MTTTKTNKGNKMISTQMFCCYLDGVHPRRPEQNATDDVAEHGRQTDLDAQPTAWQRQHHYGYYILNHNTEGITGDQVSIN